MKTPPVAAWSVLAMLVLVGCTRPADAPEPNSDEPLADETVVAAPGAVGDTLSLVGSAWRLEDLLGRGVLDRVEATLEFVEEGRVGGNASCNRFFGDVVVIGGSIAFGDLGATRMSCAAAINDQERRYLQALEEAERFEVSEPFLLIHTRQSDDPLRFIRTDE